VSSEGSLRRAWIPCSANSRAIQSPSVKVIKVDSGDPIRSENQTHAATADHGEL